MLASPRLHRQNSPQVPNFYRDRAARPRKKHCTGGATRPGEMAFPLVRTAQTAPRATPIRDRSDSKRDRPTCGDSVMATALNDPTLAPGPEIEDTSDSGFASGGACW